MRLRKFKESDAEQIAMLLNNTKIWNNLRDFIPFPYLLKDAKEFIEFCQSEDPQKTFLIDDNDLAIGVIGLIPQNDIYRKSAEIGYWLGEPYWSKGFITKAINLIVDYGFNELNLVRIYAGVFEHNNASKRVLEKSGFKYECIFEKSIIKNNKILDEYRYSIINKKYK